MDVTRLALASARALGLPDPELVERDIRLHLLLGSIAASPVGADLAFKGGTCLSKCYLDYHRFSADLDFTWADQRRWAGRGNKAGREALRRVQRPFLDGLRAATDAQGLRWDRRGDVRYGRSNRMVTIMLGYAGLARTPETIKVQVAFDDPLLFPTRRERARNIVGGPLPQAARIADPEAVAGYEEQPEVVALDPREIAAEKVRAILTRQAAKGRDVLDLFLLERTLGLGPSSVEQAATEKTRYALRATRRYREQLGRLDDRLEAVAAEDLALLALRPVDEEALGAFKADLVPWLRSIAGSVAPEQGVPRPPGRAKAGKRKR